MDWRVTLAQHAAERHATVAHHDLARGLPGLATVAATAPFVGMLGNLLGIFDSFKWSSGEKTSIMAAILGSLSESMWPTAFGMAVAVVALFSYRYFADTLAEFDAEMRIMVLELRMALLRRSADERSLQK